MDKVLAAEGWAGLEILYVGGLSLMIKFKEEEDASRFVLEPNVWRSWFSM
ncbi:hypothetical protein Hanom_Chr15g01340701 [Helianthus anomalus]